MLQMASLLDPPADPAEACKAPGLVSHKREAFKVWQDDVHEIPNRANLVLEGPISSGLAKPSAAKERLQILQQRQIPRVERQRERGPHLEASSQLRPEGKRDAEASLSLREARDVP